MLGWGRTLFHSQWPLPDYGRVMKPLHYCLTFMVILYSTHLMAAPLPGQIMADPEAPAWLMRNGGDHVFVCGPGDPEGFLYRGELLPDGTRAGDQVALIRRMLENGGNCLYLQAVRSHGGDGEADHNPFVDHDPTAGIHPRVLDQWEEWFTLMDDHGILIYFFFYDDSANPWPTGDRVEAAEKVFVETLVNRFKHHRNLIWVVAEESEEALSTERAESIVRIIRANDEHGHLVGNHHQSSSAFKDWRPGSPFDHFAMQLNVEAGEVYGQARIALEKAKGHYQLIYAENTETPQTVDGWRHHAWTVAMAGAMPMLIGMDVVTTPVEALRQCRILSEFFEDTDFYAMTVAPEMAAGSTRYVLSNGGHSFIAWWDQVEADGELELSGLAPGDYELLWLDCRTGRRMEAAQSVKEGKAAFSRPASIGSDCALYGRIAPEDTREIVQPGKEWEWRTPEEAGLDPELLDRFAELAQGRGCIVRDGRMVYAWGDISTPQDIASASKPLYTHLLFRALETGLLESADDRVAKYQPCLDDLNPALDFKDRRLTFRHLAFQTACLGYTEPSGGGFDYNDFTMGLFWDTLVNKVFDVSWDEAHDTLFERELIGPLQFEDPFEFTTKDRKRGRPRMSPRDLARFGWLYFSGGKWHGRQLVSARHVRLVASDPLSLNIPRTRAIETESCATRSIGGSGDQNDHHGSYSWLWWVNGMERDGQRWWPGVPSDMYCALGHGGKRGVAIFPSQRIVVSWNDLPLGFKDDRTFGSQAFSTLISAVR